MESNLTKQDWEDLWCNCEAHNNVRLETDLKSVHENVWLQGILYVACVICLYIMGVIAILVQAGVKFRSSSGSFCLNQILGCHDNIRRNRRRKRQKAKKRNSEMELEAVTLKQQKEAKPVIKITKHELTAGDKQNPSCSITAASVT